VCRCELVTDNTSIEEQQVHFHAQSDLWFALCTPVFSTNKTDRYGLTELLLKVALNTIAFSIKSSSDLFLNIISRRLLRV
jgi:hypothetical protein